MSVKQCRICLIASQNAQNDLSLPLFEEENTEMSPLIFEALEDIMCEKIFKFDDYSSICEMCIDLLKISYNLKKQFQQSTEYLIQHLEAGRSSSFYKSKKQKNLKLQNKLIQTEPVIFVKAEEVENTISNKTKDININHLKNSTSIDVQTDPNEFEESAEDIRVETLKKKAPNVELVLGENVYDIREVVIVEDSPPESNQFNSFLKSLGSTITASIVRKHGTTKPQQKKEETTVSITPLSGDAFADEALEPPETSKVLSKSFTCHVCDNSFDSSSYLKRHIPICQKFKNSECYICNEKKSTLKELILHVKKVHSVAKDLETLLPKYKCKKCGEEFINRYRLDCHLKQHEVHATTVCTPLHRSRLSRL